MDCCSSCLVMLDTESGEILGCFSDLCACHNRPVPSVKLSTDPPRRFWWMDIA